MHGKTASAIEQGSWARYYLAEVGLLVPWGSYCTNYYAVFVFAWSTNLIKAVFFLLSTLLNAALFWYIARLCSYQGLVLSTPWNVFWYAVLLLTYLVFGMVLLTCARGIFLHGNFREATGAFLAWPIFFGAKVFGFSFVFCMPLGVLFYLLNFQVNLSVQAQCFIGAATGILAGIVSTVLHYKGDL